MNINDLGHYVFKNESKLTVICSKCGKKFSYRGIKDSEAVKGSTYDFLTGKYKASGNEKVICDECSRKFKGGPLDGYENWKVKGN